jgi:hypothetical protein
MVLRNLKIFWQTDVQIDRQGNEFALTSSGLKGIVKHLIMKYQPKTTAQEKSRRLFTTYDYGFITINLERLLQ